MIKAIIFDMDGLIIDSEPLHFKAENTLLKNLGKRPITLKEQEPFLGRGEIYTWKTLKKKFSLKPDVKELIRLKTQIYFKLLDTIKKPMPGVITLLKQAKKKNLKIALASSSPKDQIYKVLKKLKLSRYFPIMISGEDFIEAKPDPAIFKAAAKLLNVKPEQCVVLEDSLNGVIAAKRAGMKSIAVPNVSTKKLDFSKADLIVKSLEEIKI